MNTKQKVIVIFLVFPFLYLIVRSFFRPVFLFQGFDAVVAVIALFTFTFYMLYTLKLHSQKWVHPLFAWLYTLMTFSVPGIIALLVMRVRSYHQYKIPSMDDYATLEAYFEAVNHYTALKAHLSQGSSVLVYYLFASLTLLFALWLSLVEKRKRST